jgi:hypothetical protein
MMRERQAYWPRAVGLWLLLMAAETLHGLWRVKVLAIWLGDEFARDVGVFTGSLIILLITFACIDWIPARDRRRLLRIGATWVALTIGYEVALGRFAFHLSWSEIVAEFDLSRGRVFPIGLLLLLLSPLLAAWFRGRIGGVPRRVSGPQV